mmetsp:Transcript_79842/g.234846  ORF Transcript_79842/g.234846 Transcript_79842/m.234846 type:complete len:204 (+) Transcript_79842:968-1579(+)
MLRMVCMLAARRFTRQSWTLTSLSIQKPRHCTLVIVHCCPQLVPQACKATHSSRSCMQNTSRGSLLNTVPPSYATPSSLRHKSVQSSLAVHEQSRCLSQPGHQTFRPCSCSCGLMQLRLACHCCQTLQQSTQCCGGATSCRKLSHPCGCQWPAARGTGKCRGLTPWYVQRPCNSTPALRVPRRTMTPPLCAFLLLCPTTMPQH